MLPNRVKPYQGEIFSSWFCRLALANFTEPYLFAKYLSPHFKLNQQDIDLGIPVSVLHCLIERSGLSADTIHQTFLQHLVGPYIGAIKGNGHTREVLSLRNRGGINRLPGLQFCPLCLQEDTKPYYRLIWRLTGISVCLKHQVVLSSQCVHCHAAVNIHRLTPIHHDMSVCYRCGQSLILQPQYHFLDNAPILRFQKELEKAAITGWYELKEGLAIRTPILLEGLRFMSRPWLGRESKELFYKAKVYMGIDLPPLFGSKDHSARITAANSYQRARLYNVLAWLLVDWPHRFIGFCRKFDLRYTDFFKTNARPPYWLDYVFKHSLSRKVYWVSNQEFISAIRYLYKHQYRVTPSNVAEAAGLDRSVYLTTYRKRLLRRVAKLQILRKENLKNIFHWR